MDKAKMQEMAQQGMDYLKEQQRNVGDNERWGSIAGGAVVTLAGLRRGGLSGMALGLIGGMLLYRGATGHCAMYERMGRSSAKPSDRGLLGDAEIRVSTGITIDRKPDELYSYWRDFEHLPQFMRHIVDVTKFDQKRSHWVAQAPFGKTVEWDSEVTEDVPNERIAWQSLPGSDIETHGEIRFRPAPGGKGTEVQVDMRYHPPGGALGARLAEYFNGITREQVQEDIRRFKQLMEAGELPTSEATPASPPTDASLRH
jgi:uncharacterized membrane protein